MFQRLKKFLESIESRKIGFLWWLITLCAIILIRVFLTGILDADKSIGYGYELREESSRLAEIYPQFRFFAHDPLFFLSQFITLIIILRLLTGERIEKISKVVIVFWTIIWVVPIFDFFHSGGKGYLGVFLSLDEVWQSIINCANPWVSSAITPGIRLEIVLASLLAAVYAFIKTRSFLKLAAGAILFYLHIIIWSAGLPAIIVHTINAFFPLSPSGSRTIPFFYDLPSRLMPGGDQKYCLLWLFVSIIGLALWYLLYDRQRWLALLKNIRPYRSLHYCGLTLVGIILGYLMLGNPSSNLFLNPMDYIAIAGLCLATFFACQSMAVVNDIFDLQADRLSNPNRPLVREAIPLGEYQSIGLIYFLLALNLALSLSHFALIILLVFVALYLLYSIPTLWLKRLFPFNMLVIGLNSLVAVLIGFSLFGRDKTFERFPNGFMLLIPLSYFLAANIITLKDVRADKETGVLTLPVLLGEKWGKRLIALLVFCAYLAVPLILGIPRLWIISILFGLVAGFWVLRKKWREGPFFITYFAYLAVLISHYLINPALYRHLIQGGS